MVLVVAVGVELRAQRLFFRRARCQCHGQDRDRHQRRERRKIGGHPACVRVRVGADSVARSSMYREQVYGPSAIVVIIGLVAVVTALIVAGVPCTAIGAAAIAS